jgi:hypothetical protein
LPFASVIDRLYYASRRAAPRSHIAGIRIEYPSTRRFSVVLISNQLLKSSELADWKKKIPLIAAAVRRFSRGIFAAVRSLCELFRA